ncbi:DUF5691 domain-containing protein [Streptomyces sp. LE64]|uniref:DUF5691 domain-containing protein n=1 Tax=Streptomyces sp. LE64 TaxID=3448653 RepID=UPI004041D883
MGREERGRAGGRTAGAGGDRAVGGAGTGGAGAAPDGEWEALVVAALVGTDRRGVPGGPAALLDALAARVVRRRAGLTPAVAAPLPPPAPVDPRPPTPPSAAHRLSTLLAELSRPGDAGRRGAAPGLPQLTELLPEWLAVANAHGYAPRPEVLPALLDAARARTDLRPAVLRYAGVRARWLAGLNPDWRFVLRAGAAGTDPVAGEGPEAVRRRWREGLFAERAALLESLRLRDPDAARALLVEGWAQERAEDRLMFLDALRTGLGPADEPFLEAALTDRSRNVRATAAELLAGLPRSALAGRMARRAAACVAPERGEGVTTIVVEAPHSCDPALERDGVLARPPAGRGERSWWLGQLVAAAPLDRWPGRLGVAGPAAVLALAVADGWREELHAAWCRAAVRQRNADWARALLGAPTAPEAGGSGAVSLADRARLLAVLPAAERADWVAGFVAGHGLSEAFQLLGGCAVPWSRSLGRAVVDALDIARDAGGYPWSFSGVMGLAERCLDPAEGERLAATTGLTAATAAPADAAPGAGDYWAESFRRLVATLRLRAVMLAELAPAPGT